MIEIPETVETRSRGKRILHTRKIPIRDAEGHPLYLPGISEDITDQLQASAEKENLERRLQQASPFSFACYCLPRIRSFW